MRVLLREYADRGGTALLSSHLLHEVQAVADKLVIINLGRIVANGTPEELQGTRTTVVRALDQAMLATALETAGQPFKSGADGSLRVEATTEQVGRIAASSGSVLTELREQGEDLEELFLSLTTNTAQEVAA